MTGTGAENSKVSVRIVSAKLELQNETRPALREMLRRHIEEDERLLGPAILSAEQHQQKAMEFERIAERAEDDTALDMMRKATAHALWAGDEELAVACYRKYRRLSALIDQI